MTSTTWTYNPTQLSTTPLFQVRRLIGDVLSADQQLQDDEILFAISQYANIYTAAAECCRNISAQYSRMVDLVQAGGGGNLQTNYSQRAAAYAERAVTLEARGMSRGGVVGYAGGIDVRDKINNENDPNRVTPQFNIGMDDNLLPIGPAGNETPGNPQDGGAP